MLKNKPYTRVRIIKAVEGVAFLFGLFLTPFAYLFRKSIIKHPNLWKWFVLYWFSNDSESNYIDNYYGVYQILGSDYERFHNMNILQKFILNYEWMALRNPHWNLKKLLGVGTIGEITDVRIIKHTGGAHYLTWKNYSNHGVQHIEFNKGEYRHFRKSSTLPLKRFSIMRLFGKTHKNKMLGCGSDRYISKLRYFKDTEN